MKGNIACGFKQAEGVHHVFGVVALSVCLRALVARFVAFRQPLLIGGVFAAVAAVSVLVEGEVGKRGFAFGNGAEGEVGGFGFGRDTVVATRAVEVVKQGVEFAGVGDFDQTDAPLFHFTLRKPALQRHGLRAFYDVAEIEYAFLFRRHRIADFLVQPACFFDLPVGVSGETLAVATVLAALVEHGFDDGAAEPCGQVGGAHDGVAESVAGGVAVAAVEAYP